MNPYRIDCENAKYHITVYSDGDVVLFYQDYFIGRHVDVEAAKRRAQEHHTQPEILRWNG